MDVITAIQERQSVRRFTSKTPDRETVDSLLQAAVRAPSAGNLQSWHFYVVWDQATRRRLSGAAQSQRHVAEAPVVVVVCAEPDRSAKRYGRRGQSLYCIQDAAAATQNLLLAAVAAGLGGCWVGAFDEEEVRRLLKMPSDRRPMTMVPLGYPAGPSRIRSERLDLRQKVTYVGESDKSP